MQAVPVGRRELVAKAGAWAALWGCGLLGSGTAAADTAEAAFDAKSLDDALQALGSTQPASAEIVIDVPDLAENGAIVPVNVTCRASGTREISIVVSSNPNPLVARFTIPEGTEAFVSTRVKMAESGRVYAVVKADGQLLSAFKDVKVIVGGCG